MSETRSIVVETTERNNGGLSKIQIYRLVDGEKLLLWQMEYYPGTIEPPGVKVEVDITGKAVEPIYVV